MVLVGGVEVGVEELRGFVRGRLPQYMVRRSRFVFLDELPLRRRGRSIGAALRIRGI